MSVQANIRLVVFGNPDDANMVCITRLHPDIFLYTEWYGGDSVREEGGFESRFMNREKFVKLMIEWDHYDVIQGNELSRIMTALGLPS